MGPSEAAPPPHSVKIMIAYRRAPGTTVEAFQRSLAGSVSATSAFPRVRRHVRSLTTASGYGRRDPRYDAVEELWFDGEPTAREVLGSAELHAAVRGFGADPGSVATFLVRDHLIKDGAVPPGALKNFEFVTRRPDLTVTEFRNYWLEHHGPLASGIETMRRYVQSHAIDSEYAYGATPIWEGSAITWFDDLAGMRASAACEVYAATRADEVNFLGAPLKLPYIITTEHTLIEGEAASCSR